MAHARAEDTLGCAIASGQSAWEARVEGDSSTSRSASSTCSALVGKGGSCGGRPLRDGSGLCWSHSPKYAEARVEAARKRRVTIADRSRPESPAPATELSSPRLDSLRVELARARLRLRVRTEIESRLRVLAPSDRVDVLLDLLLAQELGPPGGRDAGAHAPLDGEPHE